MERVAIVGAGPAGLAAGRYLLSQGFAPTLFDRANAVGGQWSGDDRFSATWPGLRVNTSRIMTAFSDQRHPEGTAVYPTREEMGRYLSRYAATFGLLDRTCLETGVERVHQEHATGRWLVETRGPDGTRTDVFDRVVVAGGRYQRPSVPDVQGLDRFAGNAGVIHSKEFKQPERYRGRRVLVAGCAISA